MVGPGPYTFTDYAAAEIETVENRGDHMCFLLINLAESEICAGCVD